MTTKIHSAFLYTGSSKFSTDIYILISIWSSFQPSTPLHSHSLHRHISYSINRDKKVGKGCSYFPNWFCARPILIPGSMMATWSQDKLALFLNNNKNGLYLRPLPLDTQRSSHYDFFLFCMICSSKSTLVCQLIYSQFDPASRRRHVRRRPLLRRLWEASVRLQRLFNCGGDNTVMLSCNDNVDTLMTFLLD